MKNFKTLAIFFLTALIPAVAAAEPVKFYTSISPRAATFFNLSARRSLTVTGTLVVGGEGKDSLIARSSMLTGPDFVPVNNIGTIFVWNDVQGNMGAHANLIGSSELRKFKNIIVYGTTAPFKKDSSGKILVPSIYTDEVKVKKLRSTSGSLTFKNVEVTSALRIGTEDNYFTFPVPNKPIKWESFRFCIKPGVDCNYHKVFVLSE